MTPEAAPGGVDVTLPRVLMLVSDWVDQQLRADVLAGRRPSPEYLRLAEVNDIELLDWSRLGGARRGRSVRQSLRHVAAALRCLRDFDVVVSDGEHVGVPLALALLRAGRVMPHLMIGHHLTTWKKRPFFKWLRASRSISRILVHSRHQLEQAHRELAIPRSQLAFLPYFADARFWRPLPVAQESLIVSAGREHRDYLTLARACAGLSERVFIAAGSVYSPGAPWRSPEAMPPQFTSEFCDHRALRLWYARARLVVIPLVVNDFQAGVTTLLEAMAMGKATIISATAGQRDIVEDGVTGILVPPEDAGELRRAVRYLLGHPEERARIGENARRAVEAHFDLGAYTGRLAEHLRELSGARPTAA